MRERQDAKERIRQIKDLLDKHYTYQEIAEALNWKRNSVGTFIFNHKKEFRK